MPDYISRQGEAWDQIALSRLSGERQMGDVLALNVDELDALLLSGETRVSVPERPLPSGCAACRRGSVCDAPRTGRDQHPGQGREHGSLAAPLVPLLHGQGGR